MVPAQFGRSMLSQMGYRLRMLPFAPLSSEYPSPSPSRPRVTVTALLRSHPIGAAMYSPLNPIHRQDYAEDQSRDDRHHCDPARQTPQPEHLTPPAILAPNVC